MFPDSYHKTSQKRLEFWVLLKLTFKDCSQCNLQNRLGEHLHRVTMFMKGFSSLQRFNPSVFLQLCISGLLGGWSLSQCQSFAEIKHRHSRFRITPCLSLDCRRKPENMQTTHGKAPDSIQTQDLLATVSATALCENSVLHAVF